jgi:hypothetical protein
VSDKQVRNRISAGLPLGIQWSVLAARRQFARVMTEATAAAIGMAMKRATMREQGD